MNVRTHHSPVNRQSCELPPGATRWHYFVPYCDSIAHAMASLRWETFQARQYLGDRAARSIYALRRSQGARGTHSILDMQFLGSAPDHETVSPLTRDELAAAFGTARPTRDHIDVHHMPPAPHGQGRYVVVYGRHDRPSEILFWGCSGVAESVEFDGEHSAPAPDATVADAVVSVLGDVESCAGVGVGMQRAARMLRRDIEIGRHRRDLQRLANGDTIELFGLALSPRPIGDGQFVVEIESAVTLCDVEVAA